MKVLRKCVALFLVIGLYMFLCVLHAAEAGTNDPFKIHKGTFGPNIFGLQIGSTFENLNELFSLMGSFMGFPNMGASDRVVNIRTNIKMFQNEKIVSELGFKYFANSRAGMFDDSIFASGELFDVHTDSLRERVEREKWTHREYFLQAEKIPNWVIEVFGWFPYGELNLILVRAENEIKLVYFDISSDLLSNLHQFYDFPYNDDLALFLMDKYGFSDDFSVFGNSYFYQEPSMGFGMFFFNLSSRKIITCNMRKTLI